MALPEDYQWDMPTDGMQYRRQDDGSIYCVRCRKIADDSHVKSMGHKKWVDYLLAQAVLQQPLRNAPPLPPPLTPPGEPPEFQEVPPPPPRQHGPPPGPLPREPPGFQEGLATMRDMEARLTRMEEKVLTMEAKLNDVDTTSLRGTQDMEGRLKSLEEMVSTMEAKFACVAEMVLTMEAKLKDTEAKQTTVNVINAWQEHTWAFDEEGSRSWHWRGDGQLGRGSWQKGGGKGEPA